MQVVSLNAEVRELGKKRANAKLRKEGLVPAVVYGGENVLHVSVSQADMRDLVYTPEFKVAELSVNGSQEKCIVKDMQFHPVTDELLHIDFLRLIDGHPIKVVLPLRFKGTPVGVMNGGKLVKEKRKVEVQLLPDGLVDHLVIDVSSLDMGETIRARDIDVAEGVELLMDGAIPVAQVEIPRALKSAKSKEGTTEEVAAAE